MELSKNVSRRQVAEAREAGGRHMISSSIASTVCRFEVCKSVY